MGAGRAVRRAARAGGRHGGDGSRRRVRPLRQGHRPSQRLPRPVRPLARVRPFAGAGPGAAARRADPPDRRRGRPAHAGRVGPRRAACAAAVTAVDRAGGRALRGLGGRERVRGEGDRPVPERRSRAAALPWTAPVVRAPTAPRLAAVGASAAGQHRRPGPRAGGGEADARRRGRRPPREPGVQRPGGDARRRPAPWPLRPGGQRRPEAAGRLPDPRPAGERPHRGVRGRRGPQARASRAAEDASGAC